MHSSTCTAPAGSSVTTSNCSRRRRPVRGGHAAVWDKVPEFSCTIGDSTLKYCGWGAGYEHSRLVEHRDGFTVWYESGGEVVGVLSLNADDDYRLACRLVRSHTSMTI